MKQITLLHALLFSFFIGQSQQLFFEDFNSVADGATTGTAAGTAPAGQRAWSINTGAGAPAAGSFQKRTYGGLERFTVDQTGANEGVWSSGVIAIAAGKQVAIDISLVTYNAGPADYVRAYYKLNGGPEVLFGSAIGGNYIISQGASVVLTGTSVQVVVRARENTAGDDGDGNPNMMRFDDVEVTQVTTLYSRNGGGNWGTSGTWSTIALNGTSCACTPDNTTNVIVGNNDIVNITAASDVVNATVQNTSTLQWTAGVALSMARGGSLLISDVASVNRNGNNGSQIIFPAPAAVSLTVNSSNANALSIGDIVVSGAATIDINGTGSITTGDDFLINAAATITNNLAGIFTITDDLNFNTSNATFTNNRTLTISSDLIVTDNADNGDVFTNASTGVLNVVTITPNDGNLTINNAGTINQSGNFTAVDAGSSYNNLATGTWNWSWVFGASNDASMSTVLNCSATGNTFNYNAAGNQLIIPAQYHHLTQSTSGTKSILGTQDVNGNLLIQNSSTLSSNGQNLTLGGNWTVLNTATFAEGSATVTLDGTSSQTIAAPSGEVFNNLVINNSSITSPQLVLNNSVAVTSVLTMTDGNINLNGNTLSVNSSAAGSVVHGLTSTSGWMYGGFLRRAFANSTAIAIGNVAGFFPLGSSTDFRPFSVGVNAVASTAGTITVSHNNSATSSSASINDGGTSILVRSNSFWTVSTTTISAGTFGIRYGGTGLGVVTALAHMRSCLAAGVVGTHVAASTVSTTDPRVERSSLTFGNLTNNFYVGSSSYASPLPVNLLHFNANLVYENVNLSWATAQETNNNFFTIEKSSDPEQGFQEVLKVTGSGNSNAKLEYSAIDKNPHRGLSYYRLKQTDFDGKFSYSKLVSINYEGSMIETLSVYPNPLKNNQAINVRLSGVREIQKVPIVMYNFLGQQILEEVIEVNENGVGQKEFLFEKPLLTGVFIIKAGPTLKLTQRLVVE